MFLLRTLLCSLALALTAPAHAVAASGVVSGSVSNAATRNVLEGATVAIPSLGRTTLTDNSGRYVFDGVPDGPQEVVVSYLGLETARYIVNVSSAARAVRDFELTTAIYQLGTFTVTGEREGNAQMITEKRNADNIKDVVAMDSFGTLANMSAGEVVRLMPGVAGSPTDEGLNYNFNIRGTSAGLNNVTIDGGQVTNYGQSRAFEMQSINASLFEAVEIVKGQTPDKAADSLGAAVNFRSASTLRIREDQRTVYNASVRWAPPFLEQTPIRSMHRAHPLVNITHQRVFDIFGGHRNLGASLNVFYSENAVGGFETVIDRTNAPLGSPAPVFNYQTWDNTNNRKQQNATLRLDYEWSPDAKYSLTTSFNENIEHMRRRNRVTASAGNNTTVPSATTGIIPGEFTNLITKVRPLAGNNIDVNMEGPIHYDIPNFSAAFTGENRVDNLLLEYSFRFSRSKLKSLAGNGAQLNLRLFNPAAQTVGQPVVFGGAGWIIDQTKSQVHPSFTQNGGPDFTNSYNYLPTTNGLSGARNQDQQTLRQFRLDATYKMPTVVPLSFKSGFHWRLLEIAQEGKDRRRWSFNSTLRYDPNSRVVDEPSYVSYDRIKTGRAIPFFQTVGGNVTKGFPANPALWTEDRYFYESQKYVGERSIFEWIPAYYTMAQGKLGNQGWLRNFGYLAGIRWENVRTKGETYVRARRATSVLEQTTDPVGAAAKDYANTRREVFGKYWQNFPSAHTFYNITPNLKVRASWSTSYGRPGTGSFLPGESVDETNQILTVNNPAIKPQRATNWDTTLEYYFEPVGSLTVSWFHKDIKDFIMNNQEIGRVGTGQDNGYDGEYENWILRTSLNGGSMTNQGWEFGYNQQFTFLPGLLKGLSANFNYTLIDTHGLQTGTRYLTTSDVTNFIPRVYNAQLNWRYGKYGARVVYNYTSEYITSRDDNNPTLNQYRYAFKTVNAGISYKYRPAVGFSLDVSNLTNANQEWYKGSKDRGLRRTTMNFVTITFGVNGQF